jgi:16S rRNA (guanine527-N7)-methyltransferase
MGDVSHWNRAVLDGAAALGLEVGSRELAAWRMHFELVMEHRKRAALTSLSDPADIAIKHYLDSLTCLLVRDIAPDERVADIGSGAGFPGLVLAIARRHASYVLAEATRKRAAFLEIAVSALGLENVTVAAARAEEMGRDPEHRERYDLVLSRAVAPLPVLLEYCLPLVRLGGQFLAQKGPEAPNELEEAGRTLAALGGRVGRTQSLTLPQQRGERVLILVEKAEATPPRYPRRPGIPAKRPLR